MYCIGLLFECLDPGITLACYSELKHICGGYKDLPQGGILGKYYARILMNPRYSRIAIF